MWDMSAAGPTNQVSNVCGMHDPNRATSHILPENPLSPDNTILDGFESFVHVVSQAAVGVECD